VFHEDQTAAGTLPSCLTQNGFEVTCVHSFIEAAPFLAAGHTDVLLYCLPEIKWVRNAVLTEVRRANPLLPIVAIAKTASDELRVLLRRIGLAELLPIRPDWEGIVEAVRRALGTPQPATGGGG